MINDVITFDDLVRNSREKQANKEPKKIYPPKDPEREKEVFRRCMILNEELVKFYELIRRMHEEAARKSMEEFNLKCIRDKKITETYNLAIKILNELYGVENG